MPPITVTADIPFLLRCGSSVSFSEAYAGHRAGDVGVVLNTSISDRAALVATHRRRFEVVPWSKLVLDLDDATSRAHAAWWVFRSPLTRALVGEHATSVVRSATLGIDSMDKSDIQVLKELVEQIAKESR